MKQFQGKSPLAFSVCDHPLCHLTIMHLSCTNNPQVLLWLGTFLLLLLNSLMVHWMLDLTLQSLWRELSTEPPCWEVRQGPRVPCCDSLYHSTQN